MKSLRKSVIIVGKICSGKTTLARNISNQLDMPVASFGEYVVEYCNEHNISTDRISLQNIGEKLVLNDYGRFLDDVISFNIDSRQSLIFEGVRHLNIFKGIIERSQRTFSIYIDIDIEERYKRYSQRHAMLISFDDFVKFNNHPVEKEVEELKALCNLVLQKDDLKKTIIKDISFV